MTTRRTRAADTQRSEIVCEDCGELWTCRRCMAPAGMRRFVGEEWTVKPCPPGEHDTAARVQGWTVWRERGGLQRTTILCPKHRAERGIAARVRPLEDAS